MNKIVIYLLNKLDNFLLHPLVYSSVEDIMNDVNLKTSQEFNVQLMFDEKGQGIQSLHQISRKHSYAFLTDMKLIESKLVKKTKSNKIRF
jgi:hypothetical protein